MHFNAGSDHTNDNEDFSVLDTLETYRHDGKFEMKLAWPLNNERQVWRQTSNPVTQTQRCCETGVTGYEPVEIVSTDQGWRGGLEPSGSAVLDGSVNGGSWWYAVGSFAAYGNGIPGHGAAVQEVELWVCQGSLSCPL